jgi:hypothetical protein
MHFCKSWNVTRRRTFPRRLIGDDCNFERRAKMANPYNPNDPSDRNLNDPYTRERIAESEGNGAGLFAGLVVAAVLIIGGLFMYYHNDNMQTASNNNNVTTSAPGSRAPAPGGSTPSTTPAPSPSTPSSPAQ